MDLMAKSRSGLDKPSVRMIPLTSSAEYPNMHLLPGGYFGNGRGIQFLTETTEEMPSSQQEKTFKTLLVFPPVWTPVTPYLALPLLSAYLRGRGLSIRQYDASLEFFLGYLLKEETLKGFMLRADQRARDGLYNSAGERLKAAAEELISDPAGWENRIQSAHDFISNLRNEKTFYDPQSCVLSQDGLYALLRLASLAYYPITFTFTTFNAPLISDFHALLGLCDDPENNPFLSFYLARIPPLLEACKPKLIGISITTASQMVGGLTLSRMLRRLYPGIHVTLGGRHMLRLGQSLRELYGYFELFCNSIVMGSGEIALEALITELAAGGSLESVPNLLRIDSGEVIEAATEENLPITEVPAPDFSDLPLEQYLSPTPIVPFRLSEGCYWGKCTFCSRYDTRRFATISPEKAVDQMGEVQRKFSVSCFAVNDDCLTPTYLEAFAREILERRLSVRISLWCKPVAQFTPERLQLLAKAGVRLVRWGVETGHPRILKLMNKGTDLEETRKVLLASSRAGIWNHATMILGFPTETLEEARKTIAFLDSNQDRLHSSILFQFSLLSHSYIVRNPAEFDVVSIGEPLTPFSYDHPFKCQSGMDRQSFDVFWRWASRYRLENMYGHPFWYYLRNREYLLLYAARYGTEEVAGWKVAYKDHNVFKAGDRLEVHVKRPAEIEPQLMERICGLIEAGGEVGLSWIRENLSDAFLIGFALEEGRVVGTLTHKRPKEKYVRYLMEKTGLDLTGYLERGYTYLRPEYRGRGIADRILKALVKGSANKSIYITIRMDNAEAIALGLRNGMRLAARFLNERTGHEIGVFKNTFHAAGSFPGDSASAGSVPCISGALSGDIP